MSSPRTRARLTKRKRFLIATIIAVTAISFALYMAAQSSQYKNTRAFNFDSYPQGTLPSLFTTIPQRPPPAGDGATWIIKREDSAPSLPNELAKLPDQTNSGYNILTFKEGVYVTNFKASVKFEIVSREENEQAAVGLIVRMQDASHYFVLVADSANDRFSLCRSEPEKLICIQDVSVVISKGQWHTIAAQVSSQGIAGYLDDKLLIQRYDQHYMIGQIGLWTKGDSSAYFDDLKLDY